MFARLLLVLGGTVAAMFALEVGLRVLRVETASFHSIAGFTVYDPELGWRLAPERTTVFKGAHFSVQVTHNAQGLRDRSYQYERDPGRRRILVLGDSSVWCWGVEHEDCFTERLEARLPETDVINTGVPGYSTAQELLFYEREGWRYRPDLVLLLMSPNDVTDNVDSRGPRFRLEDGRLVLTNVPVPRRKSAPGQWLQGHSRLFAYVTYLVAVVGQDVARRSRVEATRPASPAAPSPVAGAAGTVTPGSADSPGTEGEAWALTAALLERLAASVRKSGATFVLLSPVDFEPMRGWIRDICASQDIAYLDLVPALWAADRPGARLRLEGDPHFSAPGQEVLASEILAMIERAQLLPQSPSAP